MRAERVASASVRSTTWVCRTRARISPRAIIGSRLSSATCRVRLRRPIRLSDSPRAGACGLFRQSGLDCCSPGPRPGRRGPACACAAATARDSAGRHALGWASPTPAGRRAGALPAGSAGSATAIAHADERRGDPEGEVIAARQRRRRGMAAGRLRACVREARQRREHGQPERAADLGGRVDQARREARVLVASLRTSRRSSAPGRRRPAPIPSSTIEGSTSPE